MRFAILGVLLVCGCGSSGGIDPCLNGRLDPGESDVDCGGTCRGCASGRSCQHGTDCASGFCTNQKCDGASCSDGIRNGTESDLDCGGGACPGCALGKSCTAAVDCASMSCRNNLCVAGPCMNGQADGNETDIDCGGPDCGACADGKRCLVDGDCQGLMCRAGLCTSPINCTPPLANCDGNPKSGCNVDTSRDPKNCGGCGMACGARTPSCDKGTCVAARCPGTINFVAPITTPLTAYVTSLVAADLDGDGHADLVANDGRGKQLLALFGKGDGTFAAPVATPTADGPYTLVTGDVDGDGKIDVAASVTSAFQVFFNNGRRPFTGGPSFYAVQPGGVCLADATGDGKLDLIGLETSTPQVWLYANQGGGKLAAGQGTKTQYAYGLAAGDLDGDGIADAVTTGPQVAEVLLGQKGGPFKAAVQNNIAAGQNAQLPLVADLDGDKKNELACVDYYSKVIGISPSNGGATLKRVLSVYGSFGITRLLAADMDGDGLLDLLTSNTQQNTTVEVLLGTGGLAYAMPVITKVTSMSTPIVVADFDGDGRLDLATWGPNTLTVLLNHCK